jgi:hypothetical protein
MIVECDGCLVEVDRRETVEVDDARLCASCYARSKWRKWGRIRRVLWLTK